MCVFVLLLKFIEQQKILTIQQKSLPLHTLIPANINAKVGGSIYAFPSKPVYK